MSHGTEDVETWNESESELFIGLGHIFVPWREEIRDAILSLIPAGEADQFLAVDLGVGTGWLSQAILDEFKAARVLALDGSSRMLEEACRRLGHLANRLDLRSFRLQDSSWVDEIGAPVRAFVSCLAVHHIDGPAKRDLYRRLYRALEPGGALLFADIVAPANSLTSRYYQRSYERDVHCQSLAERGTDDAYQRFIDLKWNLFEYPDPVDVPSPVVDHLNWLQEAGFADVEVFWARSGHVLYGGYRKR